MSNYQAIPTNAVVCGGPLLFSPDRYVTLNGELLFVHPSTRKITTLKATGAKAQYYSWANAQQLVNDEPKAMESIEGFYVLNRGGGKVLIRALVAYYFVNRLTDPNGMRAMLIDPSLPIRSDNVEWVTRENQRHIVAASQRAMVNPDNRFREVLEDIDWSDYTEWNGYHFKNDGSRILKITTTNRIREINIRSSGDGYQCVVLYINGIQTTWRLNRLMAKIHHGNITNQVVDHLDGNILNNSLENLDIVDHTENVRRGGLATSIIKVNTESLTILEHIRSIREYTDAQGEEWSHRALAQRIGTNEEYNGFLWFNTKTEGSVYTVKNNVVTFTTQTIAVRTIRKNIHAMIQSGTITENIVPFENNILIHTPTIISIIDRLDPRGLGHRDELDKTNADIRETHPCCRLLSYFGGSDCYQIIMCLKTLLVFTRSRDNLISQREINKCPLCEYVREETVVRRKFNPNGPEATIPIYSYTPARRTASNPDTLLFQQEYLTWKDLLAGDVNAAQVLTVFKPLRQTLFGKTTGRTGARAKCQNLYFSFYPPVNNHMSETNPDWLLSRRLNSAIIIAMREYVLNQ